MVTTGPGGLDVFDVHHHVGRAFDALGGRLDAGDIDPAEHARVERIADTRAVNDGTDLYSYPVGRRISHLLPQIVESSLADADKAAILGGNARRLFGLTG